MRGVARLAAVGAAMWGCGGGAFAAQAQAATVTTNCAGLQAALTGTAAGDTVVLNQLCSGMFFTLPARAITLTGASGTGAGLDRGSSDNPAALLAGSNVGATTISHLVFSHAHYGAIAISNGNPTIDSDTFTSNSNTGVGGAVALNTANGPMTVSNSTFNGNSSTGGAGGGLSVDVNSSTPSTVTLTANTFSGNAVTTTTTTTDGLGGGAFITDSSSTIAVPISQNGNVFDSNSVTGGSAADSSGGGEELAGTALTSVGDRFSNNRLPSPGSGHFSEGAGLATENTTCPASNPAATLTNTVVAGNSIAGGGSAAHGAGIYVGYVGCVETAGYNQITLRDSTVTANNAGAAGAATGGVFGDSGDHLTVSDSIVASNGSGADVTGFLSSAVAVSFSDVCSSGAPFTGSSNICADPLLVAPGATTPDVHETAASPTIDKGSNAAVPSGLTTDFYGAPRIQAGTLGGPAVVDMGAAEYTPPAPSPPGTPTTTGGSPPTGPPSNAFTLERPRAGADGTVTDGVDVSGPGGVAGVATFQSGPGTGLTAARRRSRTVVYGSTRVTAAGPGRVLLRFRPTHAGALALRQRNGAPLRVQIRVTFTPTGGTAATHSSSIDVHIAHRATPHARKHRKHDREDDDGAFEDESPFGRVALRSFAL